MIYTKAPTSLGSLRLKDPDCPNRARTNWHPIKHSLLIDSLQRECMKMGWRPRNPLCFLSEREYKTRSIRQGVYMTASMDVITNSDLFDDLGAVLSLGLYNSNSGTHSVKLYGGVRLVREMVGVPFEEIHLAKHTKEDADRMGKLIADALRGIQHRLKAWKKKALKMMNDQLSDHEARELVMDAAKKKLLSYSRIGEVLEEIEGDISKWHLLKLFAAASKRQSPLNQMRSVFLFKEMMR